MEQIKDTVKQVIESLVQKKQDSPEEEWGSFLKKVLAKKELGHIRFNYFRKGILVLSVDSSSWLYALSLQKEKLLEKVRAKYSGLKDIRFYLGEMQSGQKERKIRKK